MKSVPALASDDTSRDDRAEKIRRDIAKRLRPVCLNLTDDDFFALIEQMTQVQLRGERRVS
jgi:hypothetical protein